MKSLSLNGWPLCIGVILLGVGCRKQDAFLTSQGTSTTARTVHPLDDPTSLFVSVYYDDSGPGYVDVSWSGEMGGVYKVSAGARRSLPPAIRPASKSIIPAPVPLRPRSPPWMEAKAAQAAITMTNLAAAPMATYIIRCRCSLIWRSSVTWAAAR